MPKRKLPANVIDLDEIIGWELIREATDLLLVGTEAERLAMQQRLERILKDRPDPR